MTTTIRLTDPGMEPKVVTLEPGETIQDVLVWSDDYTEATIRRPGKKPQVWSQTVNGDPWAPGSVHQRVKVRIKELGGKPPKAFRIRDLECDLGLNIDEMARHIMGLPY